VSRRSGRHRPTVRHDTGATALELAASLAIIAIFALFLLYALLRVQEMTERTAVEMTVMNLRSTLRVEIARYVITGQEARLPNLVGANPMRWMEPPPGYRGELKGRQDAALPRGSWYFDSEHRELVYLPHRDSELDPPSSGRRALRWQIRAGTSLGMMRGIELVPVDEVRWFDAPLR
jgi:hypothetical protein